MVEGPGLSGKRSKLPPTGDISLVNVNVPAA